MDIREITMSEQRQMTSGINGQLWGAAAEDWATIQEPTVRPVYAAVFDKAGLGAGMRYLDAGCGSGLATQMAAERGAAIFGLDAAEPLLAIARSRVPQGDYRVGELEDDSFDMVTGVQLLPVRCGPKGGAV
jgi:2-polyprenyl-3-methyl-5-hydroxy-6-metoxy-1,4-benzoquinol methylase